MKHKTKAKDKYWKKPDQAILGVVMTLILVGLAAVSSASAVLSFERYGHNNYYFFRQLGFAVVGIAAMLLVSRIDYRVWGKYARWILLAAGLALVLVAVPSLGFASGGTRAWFSFGTFLLQPSEFGKLALVFFLASWFDRKEGAESNFWFGILPLLIVASVLTGLLLLEPDLGTAIVYAAIAVIIFFAAGARWKYLFGLAVAGVASVWLIIQAAPYRIARISAFLNPESDPLGTGYHITQALIAIGSGGLWGYGFGASRQKHNYLPESIGDSIFAVMSEELGFVRVLAIVLLFVVFGLLGLRLARLAPDKFGQLTVIGLTAWVMFQTVVNMGAVTNLLPFTGITLPFISYGGSSLLSLCIAVGVMLNISRQQA